MRQVHGADVVVADDATDAPPTCDALVTTTPGVALLARAADCVPVLLADPVAGVVAAVHSGRPGLAAGVVPAAVERMRGLGARELTAWVGPHVCGACYEVPAEMREAVAAVVPEARATTSWGTPSLDLGAGVLAQLAHAGVDTVHEVGACTREDHAWPSHRRDGDAATRFAGLIWMHDPGDPSDDPGRRDPRRPRRRPRPHRGGLRRGRPRPRRGHAGGGHQVLPALRRPDPGRPRGPPRRREPPPGGRGQGAGVRRPGAHLALRRWPPEQQGGRGGGVRRRGGVPRPRQGGQGAPARRPRARSRPRRDAPGQPRPARHQRTGRGRPRPARRRWPTRSPAWARCG